MPDEGNNLHRDVEMSDSHDGQSHEARSSDGDSPAEGRGECAGCTEPSPERRRFLAAFVLASGAVASAALLVPWIGLFLTPVRRPDPEEWQPVGSPDDFPVGGTVKVVYRDPDPLPWAGYVGWSAAWIRRDSGNEFSAFTTYCTHVGCAVRWEEGAKLFLCPCHGGAFYADGSVAAGPPPRPLDRYPIRVHGGRVEIQATAIPEPES